MKPYIPFVIVYFELFVNRSDAISKEKCFKSAASSKFLGNYLESNDNF
jgi:predicted GIY-YIG superfamily endonuclease